MRDLRDQEALGKAYLRLRARKRQVPIAKAVVVVVPDYADGPFMSSDPAEHHSKTPQTLGNLDDGGTP